MTNKLQDVLLDAVIETKQGVGKAVEWVMSQMPELCEQYLLIEMVKACSSAIILAAISAGLAWVCLKIMMWAHRQKGGIGDHPETVMLLFPFLIACACAYFAYVSAMTAATIYIAPKVYLVEFAAKLVR